MRKQTEFKTIKITKELYDRLVLEKAEFQKTIGGGVWSFTDTIWEFLKIANSSAKTKKAKNQEGPL